MPKNRCEIAGEFATPFTVSPSAPPYMRKPRSRTSPAASGAIQNEASIRSAEKNGDGVPSIRTDASFIIMCPRADMLADEKSKSTPFSSSTLFMPPAANSGSGKTSRQRTKNAAAKNTNSPPSTAFSGYNALQNALRGRAAESVGVVSAGFKAIWSAGSAAFFGVPAERPYSRQSRTPRL